MNQNRQDQALTQFFPAEKQHLSTIQTNTTNNSTNLSYSSQYYISLPPLDQDTLRDSVQSISPLMKYNKKFYSTQIEDYSQMDSVMQSDNHDDFIHKIESLTLQNQHQLLSYNQHQLLSYNLHSQNCINLTTDSKIKESSHNQINKQLISKQSQFISKQLEIPQQDISIPNQQNYISLFTGKKQLKNISKIAYYKIKKSKINTKKLIQTLKLEIKSTKKSFTQKLSQQQQYSQNYNVNQNLPEKTKKLIRKFKRKSFIQSKLINKFKKQQEYSSQDQESSQYQNEFMRQYDYQVENKQNRNNFTTDKKYNNVSRRVYDVVNIMVAADVIKKQKGQLTIKNQSHNLYQQMKKKIQAKEKQIEAKKRYKQMLMAKCYQQSTSTKMDEEYSQPIGSKNYNLTNPINQQETPISEEPIISEMPLSDSNCNFFNLKNQSTSFVNQSWESKGEAKSEQKSKNTFLYQGDCQTQLAYQSFISNNKSHTCLKKIAKLTYQALLVQNHTMPTYFKKNKRISNIQSLVMKNLFANSHLPSLNTQQKTQNQNQIKNIRDFKQNNIKNIRRRIYDAINVFQAFKIIKKGKYGQLVLQKTLHLNHSKNLSKYLQKSIQNISNTNILHQIQEEIQKKQKIIEDKKTFMKMLRNKLILLQKHIREKKQEERRIKTKIQDQSIMKFHFPLIFALVEPQTRINIQNQGNTISMLSNQGTKIFSDMDILGYLYSLNQQ